MIRRSIACLCLLALVAAPALAQEGDKKPASRPASRAAAAPPSTVVPEQMSMADPHEFNPKVPTTFAGEMVDVAGDGDTTVDLYVVGDASSARQILLIHEWWGLNEHIKGLADQFADLGMRAYAVDLYGESAGRDPAAARRLMQAANDNPDRVNAKLRLALENAQKENPDARIATIGWCFGGRWSLQAAIENPDLIDACIIYYGQLEVNSERLKNLNMPVLGIFAQNDRSITPDMVAQFDDAMKRAGRTAEIHIYPADHAFANPSGERFVEEHARSAWRRTLDFLDKNL